MKFYTGVGSRKNPPEICAIMSTLARRLCADGFVLRSGAAIGADTAFERGLPPNGAKQIFPGHNAEGYVTQEALSIAGRLHPAWSRCSHYAKMLHGRNAFQVLGGDLKTPSNFVICWTPDGAISHEQRSRETGGTGTAISIASTYDIPVYNLAREDHLARVVKYIGDSDQ